MRLAEIATVSKFERLKTLCVGVTTDSVNRLFFAFFEFHIDLSWRIFTVPEQPPPT